MTEEQVPEPKMTWEQIRLWHKLLTSQVCHCLICDARRIVLETLWPELKGGDKK